MSLQVELKKPTCFIKVATTGVNPTKDRIIELSVTKYQSGSDPISITRRFNPEVEISEESSAFHGITNEDVKDEAPFSDKADKIASFLSDSDFIGFNIAKFDLKILLEEFERSGVEFSVYGKKVVDLLSIYRRFNPADFLSVTTEYGVEVPEKASTSQYIQASSDLFNNMMKAHADKEIPGTNEVVSLDMETLNDQFNSRKSFVDLAGKITLNSDRRPVFNFGKYKGKLVTDICLKEDPGYFEWVTTSAKDFPSNSISVLKGIVKKAAEHAEQVEQ